MMSVGPDLFQHWSSALLHLRMDSFQLRSQDLLQYWSQALFDLVLVLHLTTPGGKVTEPGTATHFLKTV